VRGIPTLRPDVSHLTDTELGMEFENRWPNRPTVRAQDHADSPIYPDTFCRPISAGICGPSFASFGCGDSERGSPVSGRDGHAELGIKTV